MPDKPFFVYFAPGATHAPHHVPKEWADRYRGEFDDGWDVQRERTFARQQDRRAQLPDLLQPLRGGLGVGDVDSVPVDQAGRVALGRHP